MANSRLEKVGNIFIRTTGLLRAGAMKPEERPIWYDLFAAYPPVQEPRFDRPAPNVEVRNIFYAEDATRAKFHKTNNNNIGTVNLGDSHNKSQTQQFIDIYNNLKAQGVLSEESIFDTAQDLLKEKLGQDRINRQAANSVDSNLVADFKEASKEKKPTLDIAELLKA